MVQGFGRSPVSLRTIDIDSSLTRDDDDDQDIPPYSATHVYHISQDSFDQMFNIDHQANSLHPWHDSPTTSLGKRPASDQAVTSPKRRKLGQRPSVVIDLSLSDSDDDGKESPSPKQAGTNTSNVHAAGTNSVNGRAAGPSSPTKQKISPARTPKKTIVVYERETQNLSAISSPLPAVKPSQAVPLPSSAKGMTPMSKATSSPKQVASPVPSSTAPDVSIRRPPQSQSKPQPAPSHKSVQSNQQVPPSAVPKTTAPIPGTISELSDLQRRELAGKAAALAITLPPRYTKTLEQWRNFFTSRPKHTIYEFEQHLMLADRAYRVIRFMEPLNSDVDLPTSAAQTTAATTRSRTTAAITKSAVVPNTTSSPNQKGVNHSEVPSVQPPQASSSSTQQKSNKNPSTDKVSGRSSTTKRSSSTTTRASSARAAKTTFASPSVPTATATEALANAHSLSLPKQTAPITENQIGAFNGRISVASASTSPPSPSPSKVAPPLKLTRIPEIPKMRNRSRLKESFVPESSAQSTLPSPPVTSVPDEEEEVNIWNNEFGLRLPRFDLQAKNDVPPYKFARIPCALTQLVFGDMYQRIIDRCGPAVEMRPNMPSDRKCSSALIPCWKSTFNPEYTLTLRKAHLHQTLEHRRMKIAPLPFLKRNLRAGIKGRVAQSQGAVSSTSPPDAVTQRDRDERLEVLQSFKPTNNSPVSRRANLSIHSIEFSEMETGKGVDVFDFLQIGYEHGGAISNGEGRIPFTIRPAKRSIKDSNSASRNFVLTNPVYLTWRSDLAKSLQAMEFSLLPPSDQDDPKKFSWKFCRAKFNSSRLTSPIRVESGQSPLNIRVVLHGTAHVGPDYHAPWDYRDYLGVLIPPPPPAVKIAYTAASVEEEYKLASGKVIDNWDRIPRGILCAFCLLGDLGSEQELYAHYIVSHSGECAIDCLSREVVDGITRLHLVIRYKDLLTRPRIVNKKREARKFPLPSTLNRPTEVVSETSSVASKTSPHEPQPKQVKTSNVVTYALARQITDQIRAGSKKANSSSESAVPDGPTDADTSPISESMVQDVPSTSIDSGASTEPVLPIDPQIPDEPEQADSPMPLDDPMLPDEPMVADDPATQEASMVQDEPILPEEPITAISAAVTDHSEGAGVAPVTPVQRMPRPVQFESEQPPRFRGPFCPDDRIMLENRRGIMQPQMQGRRNQFTSWSSRVAPGTALDLLPELDKLYDGGRMRWYMRFVEDTNIISRYHLTERRRLLMCVWNRWRTEKGTVDETSRKAEYLIGWLDKYGTILRRAKLAVETKEHLLILKQDDIIEVDDFVRACRHLNKIMHVELKDPTGSDSE